MEYSKQILLLLSNKQGKVILQLTFTQDPVPGSIYRRSTLQESWQELREKIKTKEASSKVIDERCQILRLFREQTDYALQQTRLTEDINTVEDLKKIFF